jgi:hypothetical protein
MLVSTIAMFWVAMIVGVHGAVIVHVLRRR